MSRIHSAYSESDRSDRLAAADVLLRQEPDEEDDEEEEEEDDGEDGKEDDDDDDKDEGYSQSACLLFIQWMKDEARTFHQGC
jgi:hypothetical protein